MITLDYQRLNPDSKEYLQGYLQAVVPAQDIDCAPLVLLRACQAQLRGERSDYCESGSIVRITS